MEWLHGIRGRGLETLLAFPRGPKGACSSSRSASSLDNTGKKEERGAGFSSTSVSL